MTKHIVEREGPKEWRVPDNIPQIPKFSVVYADPPWSLSQRGKFGAIQHYDLMSNDRIKQMPIEDLVADNAVLFLWCLSGPKGQNLAQEVAQAWGFEPKSCYTWLKSNHVGLGSPLRHATEICLLCTRGKTEPKVRNQIDFGIYPVGPHSEKPREFVSTIERMYDGPYLELFCRKRPASNKQWMCWGNQTENGADLYIPGYPVPKYSWETEETEQSEKIELTDKTEEE